MAKLQHVEIAITLKSLRAGEALTEDMIHSANVIGKIKTRKGQYICKKTIAGSLRLWLANFYAYVKNSK